MKQSLFLIIILFTVLFSNSCVDNPSRNGLIEGSFFNIDTVSWSPGMKMKSSVHEWSGSGWRGERISCQLFIEASEAMRIVELSVEDLSGLNSSLIATEHIKLYRIKRVLTDVFAEGCEKTGIENYDSSLAADPFELLNGPFAIDSGNAEMIWISINIPSDAVPGMYIGEIILSEAEKKATGFQLEVEVLLPELPPPSEWVFHLDLWQNPYSVARYYNHEPWTEDHFKWMKPTLEMLADAGQKCITTTITGQPWAGQTFDPFESMIKKNRRIDGSWHYNYSVFDAWVEFAMSCGIDQQINCYSMVSWSNEYNYFDEELGVEVNLECKPGSTSYNALWVPFLNDFNAHLLEKNWHDKTTISMDERSMEDLMEVIKLIDREAPGLKIAFAGRYHPELDDELYDLSVASKHIVPDENFAKRRAMGFKTTFYVCCVEERPNTFTFSNPAEATYLSWFAANRDFDGLLRWSYNSWTEDPMNDSRFRRFPAGDTYIVYPGGASSVRFERLREGIQDYEKIRILEQKYKEEQSDKTEEAERFEKRDAVDEAGVRLKLLKEHLAKYDIKGLSTKPASEIVSEGKELLYQLSK